MLGFDCGSPCRGLAFWIAVEDSEIIVDCFNGRELVGNAYTPKMVSIDLSDETVEVYTFVTDSGHHFYAGDLRLERMVQIINGAEGTSGLKRDPLINTMPAHSHEFQRQGATRSSALGRTADGDYRPKRRNLISAGKPC